MTTQHTDSVEATTKEKAIAITVRLETEIFKGRFSSSTLEEIEQVLLEELTPFQATQSQQVEEARDQEAKLWFETWYSHYIAPKQPLPGEFGKFATERIQMTGYQRDHALTPNHQD